MKILFVNPPDENKVKEYASEKDDGEEYIGSDDFGHFPPLGLLYVISYLENNTENHEIFFKDCVAEHISHKELKNIIYDIKPDLFALTSFTVSLVDVVIAAKTCKEITPNCHVCLGGHHPIAFPFEASKLKEVDSCICEIGVARGMTTRFISEYLQELKKIPNFYCIDTFSSFIKDDINYEIEHRQKKKSELTGFSYNNFESWKNNFKNYKFIKAIKTDVKNFDFQEIKPIKFALLDVDLYLPTLSALQNLKKSMTKGGIIIVDDVSENNSWDGAGQAFNEFVKENSLKFRLVGKKCGIIEL